jgi:hypothetical protein
MAQQGFGVVPTRPPAPPGAPPAPPPPSRPPLPPPPRTTTRGWRDPNDDAQTRQPPPSGPPPPPPPAGSAPFAGRKPTPVELKQWAKQQGWSEDFERFGDNVLQDWINSSWDVQGQKFKSKRGGVEGLWEKPTECPPGQMPSGPNEEDPCIPNDQAAQAAGGGGGGKGGAWGGGGDGWGLTDEEKAYLGAMTGLANTTRQQSEKLFGTAMPAYAGTLEHWKKVSGAYGRGAMDASLGPARETIADSYRGASAQTRDLRGAEKAQATTDLARSEAGDLGRLGAEQQGNAYGQLMQGAQYGLTTGLGGEGQAAGLYAGAQQALAQSRLTEEGYGTQQSIAKLQTSTQWRIASLQADVSREQIQAEQSIARDRLTQESNQFNQTFGLQTKQFDELIRQFNASLKFKKDTQRQDFWSQIFGSMFSLGMKGAGAMGGGG